MSSGSNLERLTQNNELIASSKSDIIELQEKVSTISIDSPTYNRIGSTVHLTDLSIDSVNLPSTDSLLRICSLMDSVDSLSAETRYFGNYYSTLGNFWITTSCSKYANSDDYFYIMVQSSSHGSLMYNDPEIYNRGYINDTDGKTKGWYYVQEVGMGTYQPATQEQIDSLLSHFVDLDYSVESTAADDTLKKSMSLILDKYVGIKVEEAESLTPEEYTICDDLADQILGDTPLLEEVTE